MSNKASEFWKAGLSRLSPKGQRMLIEQCVPINCIPSSWTCEDKNILKNMHSLLEESGTTFGLISSAEVLLDQIEHLVSFPGSHQYYGLDDTEQFRPNYLIYKCNNRKYQYQKDLYSALGALIRKSSLNKTSERFGLSLIYGFLNTKEKELPVSSEMVLIADNFYAKPYAGTAVIDKMIDSNKWEHLIPKDVDFGNPVTGLNAYCGLVVEDKEEPVVRSQILERLEEFSRELPFATHSSEYKKVYVWVLLTIKLFKKFVSDHPMVALPRSKTVDSIQRNKIPIRLLSTNWTQSVIAHELLHTLKTEKVDVSEFEEKISVMPKHSLLTLEEVSSIISPELSEKIDFIKMKVVTGVLGGRPIPNFEGGHFILLSDFLEQTLSNLVDEKKVFHGMKKYQRGIMDTLFDVMGKRINDQFNFVDVKDVKAFNVELHDWHKANFPLPTTLKIREASRFTLKDLRNELKHLQLLEIFPDILDHTERVYNSVPFQNGWAFDTSYMQDFVSLCQLESLLRVFPKFTISLHAKKLCRAVSPFGCPICNGILNPDELAIESKKQNESEDVLESSRVLNTSSETASSESESMQSDEEMLEESEASVPTEVTNENVTSKKSKKKKNVELEVRESQTCPKCSRASEFTRETNEKLRLEKIETKALRKRVKEFETTVGELGARVEELETNKEEWKKRESDMMAEIQMLRMQREPSYIESSVVIDSVATNDEAPAAHDEPEASPYAGNEEVRQVNVDDEGPNAHDEPEVPPNANNEVARQKVMTLQIENEDDVKQNDVSSKLEEIQMLIQMEKPLEKIEELVSTLQQKTNDKKVKKTAKNEKELFSKSCQSYINILRVNIEMINKDQFDLTPLPGFPVFSKKFEDAFKKVMKYDPPVICGSLLKKPDEEHEANADAVRVENAVTDLGDCLICFEDLTPEDDLLQCWSCKRHYHKEGLLKWFKTKRTCPQCSVVILDEDEYPALS